MMMSRKKDDHDLTCASVKAVHHEMWCKQCRREHPAFKETTLNAASEMLKLGQVICWQSKITTWWSIFKKIQECLVHVLKTLTDRILAKESTNWLKYVPEGDAYVKISLSNRMVCHWLGPCSGIVSWFG